MLLEQHGCFTKFPFLLCEEETYRKKVINYPNFLSAIWSVRHGIDSPEPGNQYKKENWKLWLDSFTTSYKVVLLHNDNMYAFIPAGHSVHMEEAILIMVGSYVASLK